MNWFFFANLVFFQLLWFSCVLGAGVYQLNWLAVLATLPLIALTWFSPYRTVDVMLAITAVCLGMIIDNLWVGLGILSYPASSFAPFWIGLLWFGLGLTVNHSMSWFRDRLLLGPIIVGIVAPVTYLSGERFGAVTVDNLWLTPAISITWCLVFWGMSKYALLSMPEQELAIAEQESS